MGLAFIPLYIELLGIESYGLIGISSILQAGLGLLDLGMRPALSREMARYLGGAHTADGIRTILRTVAVLGVALAMLIATAAAAASTWLASDWVRSEALPADVVADAFAIMGVVIALYFVETIYSSSIVGLQRQVIENVLGSTLATIRAVGAVVVLLFVSPTIEAFFIWQAVASLWSVLAYAAAVHKVLPPALRPVRFSFPALREMWRFAVGMLAVSVLTLLLTQTDKLLLSNLLDLAAFGYYAIASAVAAVLYRFVAPVATAFYPRFVELRTRDLETALTSAYHQSSQLISALLGTAAIALIVFADTLLFLWTRDAELTAAAAPLLRVLAAGTLLNGLMWIPYHLQLAYGWTTLTVRVNTVAVLVLVPALIVIVPRYGALGAAYVWLGLNTAYVLVSIHWMHRRLLPAEKWRWYVVDLLQPLAAACVVLAVARLAAGRWGAVIDLVVLAVGSGCALAAALLAAPALREEARRYVRRTTAALLSR
jgi:O-antigen/teichoic acid export membrane protein